MSKNKILLIGHLAQDTNHIGGQTIKSRNIYKGLKNEGYSIKVFDTFILKKTKWKLLILLWKIIVYKKIILIPAQNNLLFLVPYIFIWKKVLRKNIIIIAVGGWLGEFVNKHKLHQLILKKIGPIFLQNETLTNKLSTNFSFKNVATLHNFKVHDFTPTIKASTEKLKVVFLGRIIPKKGVELIFDVCNKISRDEKLWNITIHFIGPVGENYKSVFLNKIDELDFVDYLESIHPDKLYPMLDEYDIMLFPTKYKGEGFPGVILDALNVGMPVISTNWKDIPSVIVDGVNGYLVEVDDADMIYSVLNKIRVENGLLYTLKINALQSSEKYSAESGIKILNKFINR